MKTRRPGARILQAVMLLLAGAALAAAQDLASFEKRVTQKVLSNGLTVLIVERHEAPVFSSLRTSMWARTVSIRASRAGANV